MVLKGNGEREPHFHSRPTLVEVVVVVVDDAQVKNPKLVE